MFDPLLALAIVLSLAMVYLVGMMLGIVGGLIWDGAKALVPRFRRPSVPASPVWLITEPDILAFHGFTAAEWEEMTDAERAWLRDQFFRSKGL